MITINAVALSGDLIPDFPGYRKWRKPVILQNCKMIPRISLRVVTYWHSTEQIWIMYKLNDDNCRNILPFNAFHSFRIFCEQVCRQRVSVFTMEERERGRGELGGETKTENLEAKTHTEKKRNTYIP